MNKEQLLEEVYNYYKVGVKDVNDLIDLKKEIRDNLKTLEGVEVELDACRCEFGVVSKDDMRYQQLDKIWNELNYLKTKYQKRGV